MIERTQVLLPGMLVFLAFFAAAAQGTESRLREPDRRFQLVALDEGAGRAALIDEDGRAIVLNLSIENDDGLRLISVSRDSALIDVRFKESGDLIAYCVNLGEFADIRPPPVHRTGGTRAVQIKAEIPDGVKKPASSKDSAVQ